MTSLPQRSQDARIQAVIEKWRESAEWEFEHGSPEFGKGLDQCADELAALLAEGERQEEQEDTRVDGSKVTPRPRATASTD